MNFDWSSLILGAGLFNILLLLAYVLLSSHRLKEKREKLWFAIVALGIALILFEGIIRGSQIFSDFPHLLFVSTPIFFLIQPALLFYQASYQKRTIRYWPHLILPILNLALMFQTFSMSATDKLAMFEAVDARDPFWIVGFYIIYFTFYQYRLFKSHRTYTKNIEAEYSQNDLEWNRLSGFITAAAGVALFAIPAGILVQYLLIDEQLTTLIVKITNVAFSLISHVLLFAILAMPDLRRPKIPVPEKTDEREDYETYISQLKAFIDDQQIYLNNELSLNLLANEIGWSRSLLSTVINRGFELNFYDFVNGYRLQEFEKRIDLEDHKSYSLDHIVQQCGFTNYVSFYRYVKRTMNLTPSALIKQIECDN